MAPAARKGNTAFTAADNNQPDAAQQQAEHQEEENQHDPQEFAMKEAVDEESHQQEIHEKDVETPTAEEEEPNSADAVACVDPPQEDIAVEAVAERLEEDDPEEVEDEEDEHVTDGGNCHETVGEAGQSMQNGDGARHGDDDGGNSQVPASGKDSEGNGGSSRGKIFIGGLTRDTTTEMLTAHFKKYGEIIDSVIMKNRTTGHPRGFGFVTFADPAVVDLVLKDTHVLDGKTVEAKRTVPREVMTAPTKGPKTKKIFVGGLKTSTKEDDFRSFFEKFGKIIECQIMQDHSTGRSRGFGFVTFESEQSVEEVLAQGKMHELDGKQVEIKKAEPKRDEAPANHDRGGNYRARGNAGYDANTNFYPGFGGTAPPYYGGASAPYNRVAGRQPGYSYGTSYGYGAGYGGFYGGFSDVDDGYGGMAYNYTGYGSGSGYGNVYGSGGYGSSGRGYSSGRYHPYSR